MILFLTMAIVGLELDLSSCSNMTPATTDSVVSETVSIKRGPGFLSAAEACGSNVLPEPLSCRAVYLPPLAGRGAGDEIETEVELRCSWIHEYPVTNVSFNHGFSHDRVQPDQQLNTNMNTVVRKIFNAKASDLNIERFFCNFTFLHPLCGPIQELSLCSTVQANVRVDPLVQTAHIGQSATVTCTKQTNTNRQQFTWREKMVTKDEFSLVSNTSRRSVSNDGILNLLDIRPSEDMMLVNCSVGGEGITEANTGIAQIGVIEGPTLQPMSTRITEPSTISRFSGSTEHAEPPSRNTNSPPAITTTQGKGTTSPFNKMHLIIVATAISAGLIFGMIFVIVFTLRCRLKGKVSVTEPSMTADTRVANDNTYDYKADDDTIEHEYFQSSEVMEPDSISQHSEYVNHCVMEAKQSKGRATRMLRSTSEGRLAQLAMSDGLALRPLSHSQSSWALHGLSASGPAAVLAKPMPAMPGRKRSMTIGSSSVKPRGHEDPSRRATLHEYALINELMTRSLDESQASLNGSRRNIDHGGAQPYACIPLHTTRSRTIDQIDAKTFIPRRKQKK